MLFCENSNQKMTAGDGPDAVIFFEALHVIVQNIRTNDIVTPEYD